MADPISCLGAAASVTRIISILSKSIILVSRLTEQWNNAQLAFMSLRTQLQALTTALDQIRKWLESSEAADVYHQLTMDLNSILLRCKALISRLESHLTSFDRKLARQLSKLGKLKFIVGEQNIGDIQKMVE